jgi:hypothetical protein
VSVQLKVPLLLLRAFDDCRSTGVLDLTTINWVDPALLVSVAAFVDAAVEEGRELEVSGPYRLECRRYMSRMRLGQILDELEVKHDLPPIRKERDLKKRLLEVSLIETEADAFKLAKLVEAKVSRVNADAADALWDSLNEMGDNVPEHAESVGFMAAQTMPLTDEIHFAVADAGRGLLATLGQKGAENDRAALDLALAGTSRYDDPDRGTGIVDTHESVLALEGSAVLVSGAAAVLSMPGSQQHRRYRPWQGTLFYAAVEV